ncbi:hypothetical protein [Methylovirgula sp. 4M-Z18]|uniref:hypothetical protein n=1 Tax=Methylovirgula sp. 4M-Z18 TaxID=2293567 RepID=UPI000E2F781E|nr:hypothetical protein [Methylovirgula sp. 4M-Z18]RFB80434.1 hypothetical protein DYH55_02580 [Methylovirgula sp. 4M-Z18]
MARFWITTTQRNRGMPVCFKFDTDEADTIVDFAGGGTRPAFILGARIDWNEGHMVRRPMALALSQIVSIEPTHVRAPKAVVAADAPQPDNFVVTPFQRLDAEAAS